MHAFRPLYLILLASVVACGPPATEEKATSEPQVASEKVAPEGPAEPGVIKVVADDFSFTAPPTFPSGWVTLRFENRGAEPHFLFMVDLPEGVIFDDYAAEVAQPFNEYYAKYRSGELDQAAFIEQLTAVVPEWFMTARRAGGPGFTSPGEVSETTIYLEPGNYTMECYVRTMAEDDTFHGKQGMLRPLIVTDEPSGRPEPEADIDIRLSNYELAVEGDLTAGKHVVRVTAEEAPEGLITHNVHLVRLDEETSGEDVAAWMDWVDAMVPPAPATFLGGAGQASPGPASYFTVNLEPGRYAWVSEDYGRRGMVHEFTVG